VFSFLLCQLEAGVIFVKAGGNGNGSSWAQAMGSLHKALHRAKAGDQIWVAAGTYYAAVGNDRNSSFVIKNGVQVYGGFAGNESSIEQRNLKANFTILSGEAGTPGNAFDNAYTVVTIKQANASTVLNGLVIEKGGALGTEGTIQGFGAGLVNDGSNGSSNPLIENCIFRNNIALEGAALYNFGQGGSCNPIITNCHFVSNESYLNGGAIFNNGSRGECNPVITNCLFENNKAVYGAGILNQAEPDGKTVPQIRECRFVGNVATKRGSSIYNESTSASGICEPVILGCIHESNSSSDGNAIAYRVSTYDFSNMNNSGY